MQSKDHAANRLALALALVVSFGIAACSSAAPAPNTVTVNVSGLDTFKYDPPSLTLKVGQPVHLVLANKGSLIHTFVVDELSVKIVSVQGGSTGETTFTPAQAGTYVFYCDTPGHKAAGMTGTLTVAP